MSKTKIQMVLEKIYSDFDILKTHNMSWNEFYLKYNLKNKKKSEEIDIKPQNFLGDEVYFAYGTKTIGNKTTEVKKSIGKVPLTK